jgi:hypothetical protein
MGRRSSPRPARIPAPLRTLLGGAVLVGAIRTIDAIWIRASGRRPPIRPDAGAREDRQHHRGRDTVAPDPDAAAPSVVRDRLLYALLLEGALRLARRTGLREEKDAPRGRRQDA